ncbi:type II toxin-antitoxin system RelE/ParE family toxin [Phenylobacterium sp.]|jgi:toxin ParE1/3/4|uniref:type II toxin-antitoxin system RelE/ParE family toxin n=1 Tax=Phenylobacterium sp. TaxID=1871053 RepID=UPI0037C5B46F
MADYRIVVSPEADAQLIALYRYIAVEASPRTAERFVGKILDQCEKLSRFPERGAPRNDIRPGLRTLAFRGVVIAFAVGEGLVTIVGVFNGGQDFESMLTGNQQP